MATIAARRAPSLNVIGRLKVLASPARHHRARNTIASRRIGSLSTRPTTARSGPAGADAASCVDGRCAYFTLSTSSPAPRSFSSSPAPTSRHRCSRGVCARAERVRRAPPRSHGRARLDFQQFLTRRHPYHHHRRTSHLFATLALRSVRNLGGVPAVYADPRSSSDDDDARSHSASGLSIIAPALLNQASRCTGHAPRRVAHGSSEGRRSQQLRRTLVARTAPRCASTCWSHRLLTRGLWAMAGASLGFTNRSRS